MVNLIIDGKQVRAEEGSTILQAAASVGIKIPTLCYLKEINEIGSCRVCVVEIEGSERLSAACDTFVEEGMVVHTNSKRAREARKTNVELILSQHDCNCPTCVKSGNCKLQSVASDLNIVGCSYEARIPKNRWDYTLPLIRKESKCIKCLRCVNVCEKIQNIGVWQVTGMGSRTTIDVKDGLNINDSNCTYCGQCVTHCPVGALRARDDTERTLDAISDPEIITVAQIAPAVRAAWGDGLGLSSEKATVCAPCFRNKSHRFRLCFRYGLFRRSYHYGRRKRVCCGLRKRKNSFHLLLSRLGKIS